MLTDKTFICFVIQSFFFDNNQLITNIIFQKGYSVLFNYLFYTAKPICDKYFSVNQIFKIYRIDFCKFLS